MKSYTFPFAIAYADTDAEGIVYHGRYIEIAERARMHMLRGIVVPNGDIGWVIRELNVKYILPLRLADEFVVESRIIKFGAASMQIEQKFVKDDEIYAIINVNVVYIGANMRPARIPIQIIESFKGCENDK
ncbi:MAG: thioesterase family protein [Muribaculaceae bacterium]|nr:thioesterase family protein [Muribaculaceae bacterium]